VVMLSQKPRRRMSRLPQASRVVERARAAVADRQVRATEQRARGRTSSHGCARSPDARRRERDAAAQASGSRRRLEGGKLSSLQAIENTRNRVGISPNPPLFGGPRCNGGDHLAEPKGSRRLLPLGVVRGNRRGMRGGEIFLFANP
jgi:hypothetical protein